MEVAADAVASGEELCQHFGFVAGKNKEAMVTTIRDMREGWTDLGP